MRTKIPNSSGVPAGWWPHVSLDDWMAVHVGPGLRGPEPRLGSYNIGVCSR